MPTTIRRRRDGSYTLTLNDGQTIHTVVTSSADDVEDWFYNIGTLPRRTIVGVDVKCRLPLDPDDRVIALLSLCIGRRCLVFQIFHAESIPYVLRTFFRYSGCRFVCMSARGVANDLWDECRLRVRNRVDLGELAAERMARPDLRWAPLRVLEQEVLGVEVNIRCAIGAWDQNPLSKVQIARACAAVFMASEIGRWLLQ
ncbi:uncharacterized protein LOC109717170 [Ananas comosus]|nr:uncharacterized protein LOC109717170 [Ananas comosus]